MDGKSGNFVTILCSNYNSAEWVEGYCDSINSQLLSSFDLVVCDANSDDGSREFFKEYKFREGIKVIFRDYNSRVGVYEAWNGALDEATTPYVMNVNTDDRLFPGALTTMLGYAVTKPDIDIFYSRCLVTNDKNHSTITQLYDWPEYSHKNMLQQCLCGPFPLLKRDAIVKSGNFNPEYTISGDYEMWLRLSKEGFRFMKVKEPIGSYYFNPKGVSTDPSKFEEHLRQDTELRKKYS